ncbi:hypothetical protein [Citreimonas salinaria]|uniref:Uncharacterized protein n=1 Tax=Citreimonas salinaria TaxID=321339 RepID=A0A1H3LIX5_9RHOB|nr:hypothetical protein [Citreimonas salinaria]SDY64240.1 hypothetical protein SAMN05444340_11333 [Citreimonas salinaria]
MTKLSALARAAAVCGARAQEEPGARLLMALNAADTEGAATKMSLVVINGHDGDASS